MSRSFLYCSCCDIRRSCWGMLRLCRVVVCAALNSSTSCCVAGCLCWGLLRSCWGMLRLRWDSVYSMLHIVEVVWKYWLYMLRYVEIMLRYCLRPADCCRRSVEIVSASVEVCWDDVEFLLVSRWTSLFGSLADCFASGGLAMMLDM